MRFILDRALFAPQSPRDSIELSRFLLDAALTDLQPPAVLLDPPYMPGVANPDVDAWLAQRGADEATAFRDLLERGNLLFHGPRCTPAADSTQPLAYRFTAAPEVRVEVRAGGTSDWAALRLNLADACDLLREPVHVVLENDINDLAFVHHLAGPTSGPLLRSLGRAAGRINPHGGGSGQAKNWLEELTKPPATPEKWRRVLRTWVLFDQDSGEQDALDPSSSATKMMAMCEKVHATFSAGLSWICLRRREIESYVPDSGLRDEAPTDRRLLVQQLITWRGISPPPAGSAVDIRRHAWAFDLKKGLVGDMHSNVPKADRDAIKARHRLPRASASHQAVL